jgi:hypothetical protein
MSGVIGCLGELEEIQKDQWGPSFPASSSAHLSRRLSIQFAQKLTGGSMVAFLQRIFGMAIVGKVVEKVFRWRKGGCWMGFWTL